MSTTELTLNQSFFDQLWPLILDENICDIQSKNTAPYFVPLQPFDQLWAHDLLAKKGYGDYEQPIDFICRKCATSQREEERDGIEKPQRISIDIDDGDGGKCEFEQSRNVSIKTVDQQIFEYDMQQKWRENLAYEFINRNHPWYMPKPSYEFELSNDLLSVFADPFERGLLRAIHIFNCRFLIVNLGADICWHQIENWVKFCKFLKILIIVRKEELVKTLSGLNESIMTMIFDDNFENTWQQELTRALDEAVIFAVANRLMEKCNDSFVFVFSSRLDLNFLDRFKVLRRS